MAKRGGWLGTLQHWLTDPPSMPLASLTHFAEDIIRMDIDIAREDGSEEDVKRLESALEALDSGDMCVGTIYSYASVGVLHEYERVFEESLRDEQDDTTD